MQVALGSAVIPLEPTGSSSSLLGQMLKAPINAALADGGEGALPFSFTMKFTGSSGVSFFAGSTDMSVRLQSNWEHPSFQGAFLPVTRSVRADGFDAEWIVPHYGSETPLVVSSLDLTGDSRNGRYGPSAAQEAVVQFLAPLDGYSLSERAMKYDLLFFGLIFLGFFLSEICLKLRIHPLQYLMVGAAITLFYLLLLSLSEHLDFGKAYFVSVLLVMSMSLGYFRSIDRGRRGWLAMASLLGGMYGFLYAVLLQEDYALIAGSLGLAAALAITMYLTRNINWYAPEDLAGSVEA